MATPAQQLQPLQGAAKILGTFALALATFMNVLDTSIANVSLSSIGGDLGAASTQVTWVITSFAVANAIAVPLTGWLTQRFGAVRLFVTSIILFTIASLLCGLATSLQMLIVFRVLQGAVAGPMIPLSQAITWAIYRSRETPRLKLPIDTIGLGLLIVWVGALQIMLDKGEELDWFNSGTIIALAVVAVVAFCVFLVWELIDNRHPVVDLRLFKGRNFWTGTLALSLGYGVFFGNVVVLPLWLIQFMDYKATDAGLLTAPVGILALLLSPFVGKRVGKTDPRILATIAFVIFAISLFMRTRYNTQANFGFLVVPIIIQGAAMAFFFVPLVSLVLSGLPPEKIPAASGLSNFARITAGSFGTSIATTLWDNRAILHHAQLTESIAASHGPTQQYLQTLQQGGLSYPQAAAAINRSIDVQAHLLAANDLFLISGILFVALIGVIWLAKRPKAAVAADSAAGAH